MTKSKKILLHWFHGINEFVAGYFAIFVRVQSLEKFLEKKTINVKIKSVKLVCMKCFIWKPYNLIQNILKWLMCTPNALSTLGSCRIQTKKLVYTSRLLNPANNQSGSRHTLCPSFSLLTSAKYPRLTYISWINRLRSPSWKYFQVQVLCDSDIIYTGIYCRSVILSYMNWSKLITNRHC